MSATAHILIIDDDRRIRELLQTYLRDNGFAVTAAADAAQAREKMRVMRFDLLIVDIMMPGESGLDLTRSLRRHADDVAILFLSALADTDDRVTGLTSGGDDYLTKPFEPRELLARVNAILRRAAETGRDEDEATFGPYRFHIARGELRRGEELVRLTTRERDMLRLLARRGGRTVERIELSQSGGTENLRGVDVQINRLRRKIEDNPSLPVYLQTVRGIGYTLNID